MRLILVNKAKQIAVITIIIFLNSILCLGNDIITITPISTTCNNANDGMLKIQLDQKEIQIKFEVFEDTISQKRIYDNTIKEGVTIIDNLKAKKYYIKYTFNEKTITEQIQIHEPAKLEPGVIKIEKGLDNINNANAILVADPIGGTKPYTFKWSENTGDQKTQKAINIRQGTYYCEINDVNNCGPVRATIFFNQYVFPKYFKTNE